MAHHCGRSALLGNMAPTIRSISTNVSSKRSTLWRRRYLFSGSYLPIANTMHARHKAASAALGPGDHGCTERLDIVPAQLRVLVVRQPKYACRTCEELVVQGLPVSRTFFARRSNLNMLSCAGGRPATNCLDRPHHGVAALKQSIS